MLRVIIRNPAFQWSLGGLLTGVSSIIAGLLAYATVEHPRHLLTRTTLAAIAFGALVILVSLLVMLVVVWESRGSRRITFAMTRFLVVPGISGVKKNGASTWSWTSLQVHFDGDFVNNNPMPASVKYAGCVLIKKRLRYLNRTMTNRDYPAAGIFQHKVLYLANGEAVPVPGQGRSGLVEFIHDCAVNESIITDLGPSYRLRLVFRLSDGGFITETQSTDWGAIRSLAESRLAKARQMSVEHTGE